ncbi:TadE/TadG family type IV pilus assembly protein [Lichenibacterium minor]|nr:Tad domain-containing protein [Lichenibacterium minor]
MADRGGSLLVWFAIALVPLMVAVGSGLDYGRSVNLRTRMQNATDAAALAGATAYTSSSTSSAATAAAKAYMDAFVAQMPSTYGITYTITPSSTASGSTYTLYNVTVTASGAIENTLMKIGGYKSNTVATTSTAENPVYTMTLTLTGTASSAYDIDSLYYYVVPTDNSVPTSSALTQFYTNTSSSYTKSFSVQLTAGQKLGFAMYNVTGGRTGYGSNAHGAAQGSTHWFYSHLMPPNSIAYPSVTKDCSLEVTTSTTAFTSGSCFSALPTYSTLNCSKAPGQTIYYWWNDMGGGSDDYDYNDMTYTVVCSKNNSSEPAGVVLTN